MDRFRSFLPKNVPDAAVLSGPLRCLKLWPPSQLRLEIFILMHWTIISYITPLPRRSNSLWWYMCKVTLCNVYYFSSVHSFFSSTNPSSDRISAPNSSYFYTNYASLFPWDITYKCKTISLCQTNTVSQVLFQTLN